MASTKPNLQLVRDGTSSQAPGEAVHSPEHRRRIEALYHEYRQSLLSYIASLLKWGQQDAQEILQETYIRLMRQDDLGHLERNPKAYLFTIATNLVRDRIRREASRRRDAHVPLEDQELVSNEPSPANSVDLQQSLEQLKTALMQLKPVTRQVFLLCRFEEMTHTEVAAALDISTRTVERHMSKACQALQFSLADLYPNLD
jgi:RNA polymerase sigma-70 factor (ECF subfamily)